MGKGPIASNAGYMGSDRFTFAFRDPLGPGNTATVWIDVYNNAPYAWDASYSVLHDTTLSGQVYGYDPDGDAITAPITAQLAGCLANLANRKTTAHLVTNATHGTVNLNADGTFTYTPNAGYVGSDSFTFSWSEGLAVSNSAMVSLDVYDGPLAAFDDFYSDIHFEPTQEGWLILRTAGVLANDHGSNLTVVSVVEGPGYGEVIVDGNGTFRYLPTRPYDARPEVDTFVYEVTDGISTATATVHLALRNNPYARPLDCKKDKGKCGCGDAPNVPAVWVRGPGKYPIERNSIIFISNNTVPGNYWGLWWETPWLAWISGSVTIHEGISSWQPLVQIVNANYADGSLSTIYISGHGSHGGVATADPASHMTVDTLTDQQAAVLRRKLSNDGVIVIFACCQASGRHNEGQLSSAEKIQRLADKIGKPVIANTKETYGNGHGDGNWYKFTPRRQNP